MKVLILLLIIGAVQVSAESGKKITIRVTEKGNCPLLNTPKFSYTKEKYRPIYVQSVSSSEVKSIQPIIINNVSSSSSTEEKVSTSTYQEYGLKLEEVKSLISSATEEERVLIQAELNKQVAELKKLIDEKQCGECEAGVQELIVKIEGVNADIDALKKQVESNSSEIEGIKAELALVKCHQSEFAKSQKDLEKEVSRVGGIVLQHEGLHGEYKNQFAKYDEMFANLSLDFNANAILKTSFNGKEVILNKSEHSSSTKLSTEEISKQETSLSSDKPASESIEIEAEVPVVSELESPKEQVVKEEQKEGSTYTIEFKENTVNSNGYLNSGAYNFDTVPSRSPSIEKDWNSISSFSSYQFSDPTPLKIENFN